MKYRIKNWEQHQHFKDRTPPWIKLHRELLNDPDWFSLSGDDAKALIMLWLIASEDKTMSGALPDVRTIAFRLRKTENETNQQLTRLQSFLYQDDISVISDRYQVDAPETETETETEKNHSSPDKPDDGFETFWKAYPRKVGKGAALKAWGKIKSKADTLQAILSAITWQRASKDWTKDGGQYIPHPSTWLNEQRWLDEQPGKPAEAIPFDREAYEAKRKAEADAAKERMRREQAEFNMSAQA